MHRQKNALNQKPKMSKTPLWLNVRQHDSITSTWSSIHPMLHLQRVIGNKVMQRVIKSSTHQARITRNLRSAIQVPRRSCSLLSHSVLQRAPYDSVRALNIAIGEWSNTVREFPPCANRGTEVDQYLSGRRGSGSVLHNGIRYQCGQPWCAYFIRWCLNRAGISHGIGGAARSVKNWGQQMGWYHQISSGFKPDRGDIFFKPPSGTTSHPCDNTRHPCISAGGSGHAGFVLGNWGSFVTTIEGNVHTGADNDGISSKARSLNELDGVVRIP